MGGHPGMRDPFGGSSSFGAGDMGGGMGGLGGMMGGQPFGGMGGGMGGHQPFGGMGGGMGGGHQQPFGGKRTTTASHNQSSRPAKRSRYDAIPEGTVVSLKGLVSKPERNGDRGQIVQYDPSSGRYVVYMEDSDETMKVKPSNLLQHTPATIRGLESRPELNGQRATVLAWDDTKQRYNLYVASVSKTVSLKPSNVVLEDGTVGMITGLQSKPELNGQWGTVQRFNADSGRYDVQLSEDRILRLKPDNIRL